jgi:hypothetical protein
MGDGQEGRKEASDVYPLLDRVQQLSSIGEASGMG